MLLNMQSTFKTFSLQFEIAKKKEKQSTTKIMLVFLMFHFNASLKSNIYLNIPTIYLQTYNRHFKVKIMKQ